MRDDGKSDQVPYMTEKYDIVYPLMERPGEDDFELRYSLRSIDQLPWVGDLYLIGHAPEWIKDAAFIRCPDPYYRCKDANIINKILRACCEKSVSEKFIVNSDDQYVLKPINPEDLGPWLENPPLLPQAQKKRFASRWAMRIVETAGWLTAHGFPERIFQSHIPYAVEKEKYPHIMSWVPWGQDNGFHTHIYQGIRHAKDNIKPEPNGLTVRFKGPVATSKEIDTMLMRATFFNFGDQALNQPLRDWLMKRFPEPSRWEK